MIVRSMDVMIHTTGLFVTFVAGHFGVGRRFLVIRLFWNWGMRGNTIGG